MSGRSVRLGRAEPVVQHVRQPARHESVARAAIRRLSSATRSLKTHGKHTFRFGGDYREHPARQPHRRERARQLRLHRPLHRRPTSRITCSACRSRRRCSSDRGSNASGRILGSVRAGRLAASRQADGQCRAALRVLLAALGGGQPPRHARRARRVSPPPCRSIAGATGPFSGALPDTIVRPFRNGFAPRIGIAWRAEAGNVVVRAGYGINYNASAYQSIAQQLAAQPPFATTDTVLATRGDAAAARRRRSLTVAAGRDDQHLRRRSELSARLRPDLESRRAARSDAHAERRHRLHRHARARTSTSCARRIAGPTACASPACRRSSGSRPTAIRSCTRSTVRLRKRLTQGHRRGRAATRLSKSIDDASSIGGGGSDRRAERSGSRRRARALELRSAPPLRGRLHLRAAVRREQAAGSTAAPRRRSSATGVLQRQRCSWPRARRSPRACSATSSDVARGTNGTLRANYNGAADRDQRSDDDWLFFNTAAFSIPRAGHVRHRGPQHHHRPGHVGDEPGPDAQHQRSAADPRAVDPGAWPTTSSTPSSSPSIDTVVNSPTFGQVHRGRGRCGAMQVLDAVPVLTMHATHSRARLASPSLLSVGRVVRRGRRGTALARPDA